MQWKVGVQSRGFNHLRVIGRLHTRQEERNDVRYSLHLSTYLYISSHLEDIFRDQFVYNVSKFFSRFGPDFSELFDIMLLNSMWVVPWQFSGTSTGKHSKGPK